MLAAIIVAVGYFTNSTMPVVGIFLAIAGIVTLIGLAAYVYVYTSGYINVTPEQVIVYTQVSVFGSEISHADMEEIEDVLVNKSGIFQLIFNYGTLEVQTAGTKPNFSITDLAKPDKVKAEIIQFSTGK